MFGLFNKRQRVQDLANEAIQQFVRQARSPGRPEDSAIVLAAIGLYTSCLSAAPVRNDNLNLLTPINRAVIARELLRNGNCIAILDNGRLSFASGFEVLGGRDPMSWEYRVDFALPDKTESRMLAARDIFHWRIGVDARTPHLGKTPLRTAYTALRNLNNAEEYARLALGQRLFSVLNVSSSGAQQAETIKKLIEAAEDTGRVATIGNVSDQAGVKLEANPPLSTPQANSLRQAALSELALALNIPAQLLTPGMPIAGQAVREHKRQFLTGAAQSMAVLITSEIEAKTGMSPAPEIDLTALLSGQEQYQKSQAIKTLGERRAIGTEDFERVW